MNASMKAGLLALSFVPAFAVTSTAIFGSDVRVWVDAASADTDTSRPERQAVMESAQDLQEAIIGGVSNGLALTAARDRARIVVRVTSREAAPGDYRVHAHVTTIDGRAADFTGTSTRQWKQGADDLIRQLAEWVQMHRGDLKAATLTP
jgi:hypothetical protein